MGFSLNKIPKRAENTLRSYHRFQDIQIQFYFETDFCKELLNYTPANNNNWLLKLEDFLKTLLAILLMRFIIIKIKTINY